MWSMHRHQRRDSAELFVSTSHDPLLRLPLSRSQYMLCRSRYVLCRSQYILSRPRYIRCRSSTFVTHTQSCHRHPNKVAVSSFRSENFAITHSPTRAPMLVTTINPLTSSTQN